MEQWKVFFVEPTGSGIHLLRRFCSGGERDKCPTGYYHHAEVVLAEVEKITPDEVHGWPRRKGEEDLPWPTHCACGFAFAETDEFYHTLREYYKGAPDGQLYTMDKLPIGACWDASWERDTYRGRSRDPDSMHWHQGPDGRTLYIRLPGGSDWCPDHRASNCTMKDDNTHKCWVRHGNPEDGTLHVDKNGHTCQAGAGSIATKNWHGFCHNGYLRP